MVLRTCRAIVVGFFAINSVWEENVHNPRYTYDAQHTTGIKSFNCTRPSIFLPISHYYFYMSYNFFRGVHYRRLKYLPLHMHMHMHMHMPLFFFFFLLQNRHHFLRRNPFPIPTCQISHTCICCFFFIKFQKKKQNPFLLDVPEEEENLSE